MIWAKCSIASASLIFFLDCQETLNTPQVTDIKRIKWGKYQKDVGMILGNKQEPTIVRYLRPSVCFTKACVKTNRRLRVVCKLELLKTYRPVGSKPLMIYNPGNHFCEFLYSDSSYFMDSIFLFASTTAWIFPVFWCCDIPSVLASYLSDPNSAWQEWRVAFQLLLIAGSLVNSGSKMIRRKQVPFRVKGSAGIKNRKIDNFFVLATTLSCCNGL